MGIIMCALAWLAGWRWGQGREGGEVWDYLHTTCCYLGVGDCLDGLARLPYLLCVCVYTLRMVDGSFAFLPA